MEPLDPQTIRAILHRNPAATPADIDEYQRLLSREFATDPDFPTRPGDAAAERRREERIAELHRKLFPQ